MLIGKTSSVCPVCLNRIPAGKVVGEDGNIYMEKRCFEHGSFRTLIWEGNLESYRAWSSLDAGGKVTPVRAVEVERGCPYDCGLCQNHERDGCCVLLELTNRCNLRCPVCFASAGEQTPKDLSLEEIGRQYDLLMERGGPFNIQLSGGEPTMRDDLPEIIALGKEKGFTFFQLNTNGVRLAEEPEYAGELKKAGVSVAFLQFDGLNDEIYRILRGRPLLEIKLKAVENCKMAGLPVVLVPTVAPGVNDHALGEILSFALERMPHIRGVHFQPISYFGRCGLEAPEKRLTIPQMLRLIEAQTDGRMKGTDFGGGGAENPYCSFHASYMRKPDGSMKALPRRRSQCCCVKSSEARDFVSRQWSGKADLCDGDEATSSLDEFLQQAVENTFTVSGMVFQDAWNLDLERLKRCYICEVDLERGMVPFCAYNLTDINGKALYRR
ncbi:MAG: radical SAM protein [Oscillospiraceae bacterium]|nr:radical SAM protein [Oscillospiraceae bacterium]